MNKVFIINGAGGVGKDTFINFVSELHDSNKILNISTVDEVKKVAKKLGWQGKKTPQDRKFLSDLKDMMTYWEDVPFSSVYRWTNNQLDRWKEYGINDGIIFIHCREPQEIERLKQALKATTLLITRETNESYINHADLEVNNYEYDVIISNNSTLENLKCAAESFLKIIKAED